MNCQNFVWITKQLNLPQFTLMRTSFSLHFIEVVFLLYASTRIKQWSKFTVPVEIFMKKKNQYLFCASWAAQQCEPFRIPLYDFTDANQMKNKKACEFDSNTQQSWKLWIYIKHTKSYKEFDVIDRKMCSFPLLAIHCQWYAQLFLALFFQTSAPKKEFQFFSRTK